MGAAVAIGRLDMTASALRAAASREKDGAAARRLAYELKQGAEIAGVALSNPEPVLSVRTR
jgi:hypothetical protein